MPQLWNSLGNIYDGNLIPGYTYAAVPIAYFLDSDVIRIIFSSRDSQNRSLPFFLDYNLCTRKIIQIIEKPILELGSLGTFDDSGVMPTCLVELNSNLYLYYIGWNLGKTVPFRNSLGITLSENRGENFRKLFYGPILDRTKDEPHFNASSCVLIENGLWKIWYLSCLKWEKENGIYRHYYHIKYAESIDGINWDRTGRVAIDFKYKNEYAISVPRVIKQDGIYKMWYSYRGSPLSDCYKIGYAESADGKFWDRKDEEIIFNSENSQWDSEMKCYPFIFDYNNKKYMLYNGNGYGKTGIGLAEMGN